VGAWNGRSGHLGPATFTQVNLRSKQLKQLTADRFVRTVLVTAYGFCGLTYTQRDVVLLGSCPKLFAHRPVRLSAGKAPHFANLGGPSSAPKTSTKDDKGEP
jgi:hypothetical protein